MNKILIVSEDKRLLETRAAVLRRTNAKVTEVLSETFEDQLSENVFDLVVICYTLPRKRRVEICRSVHRSWPHAQILDVVHNEGGTTTDSTRVDATVVCGHPENLIARAFELLGHGARTGDLFH